MAQTVLVETGQKAEVSIQMIDDSDKEKMGKLSVASEPAVEEALVFIDGLNKGPAPWSGVVKSGHHKIEVRAPNYACDPDTMFVKGNQQNVVTIKLYPIAKLNASGLLAMFEAEAAGLAAILATDTLRAPAPVALGTSGDRSWLVLEYIAFGRAGRSTGAVLGERLAQMHRCTAPAHGWDRDNTIGATPQPNPRSGDWVEFLRRHRLGY